MRWRAPQPFMREPFTFDLSDPASWQNFPAPYLNPRFVRELTEIGGVNLYGEPNLIFEWGGSALEEIDGEPGLKFYLCTTPPRTVTIKQTLAGVMVPQSVSVDIGVPRWFVTRWIEPHEGWPRGRYVYFMRLDNIQGGYEEVTDAVMERIKGHLAYTRNRERAAEEASRTQQAEEPALIS